MNKYYLAHSLTKRSQIRKWQIRLEGKYNILFTNPFYNNEYERAEIKKLDKMKTKHEKRAFQRAWDITVCQKIVEIDLNLVRKSDGVVSYFEQPTIGTCQEIIMAAYVYRIPVYIIAGENIYHPWLRILAHFSGGAIFSTRRDFEQFVKENIGVKQ